MRRLALLLVTAAAWAEPTVCRLPSRAAAPAPVALRPVLSELFQPVKIVRHRGGWYVVEHKGLVKDVSDDGSRRVVLDLTDRVTSDIQWGLQSLAVRGNDAFVAYTRLAPGSRPEPSESRTLRSVLSRIPRRGDKFDAAAEQPLIEADGPAHNPFHPIADLAFGPDGYLYVSWGSNGPRGENPYLFAGKVLRLDVSGAGPYRVPADNPFVHGGARPEVWAMGFRNPWRMGFDRKTGQLWLGDVGSYLFEEVNRVEAGKTYGWMRFEGYECLGPPCDRRRLGQPVVAHRHTEVAAVIGGVVYRGHEIPALRGAYLYADNVSGGIWALSTTGRPEPRLLLASGLRPSAFAEDEAGEVYVVDYGDPWQPSPSGAVHRLVAAPAAPAQSMPQALSATGCRDAGDARRPAAGLVPYDVNAPTYAGPGVRLRRWMSLPRRAAEQDQGGNWLFRQGDTLVQDLSVEGFLVETRILVREEGGDWATHSYEWNDAQTDARLVTREHTRALPGGRRWRYAGPGECPQCHRAASGRVLGVNRGQLRQLDELAKQLTLGGKVEEEPPPLADPADEQAPLELRARSYLHSHCAQCHRPGGVEDARMDLRAGVGLANMGVCGAAPVKEFTGVKLVEPGHPERSLVSLRMHRRDIRMPPVGDQDAAGAELVDRWIRGLGRCP